MMVRSFFLGRPFFRPRGDSGRHYVGFSTHYVEQQRQDCEDGPRRARPGRLSKKTVDQRQPALTRCRHRINTSRSGACLGPGFGQRGHHEGVGGNRTGSIDHLPEPRRPPAGAWPGHGRQI